MARYLNPFNDFGGKYLFGHAKRKKYTIHFLNALFEGRLHIADVAFKDKEHLGEAKDEARHIFDVICTGDKGETFVIEFQIGHMANMIARSIVYASKAFVEQTRKQGDYAYALQPVHLVVLSDEKLRGIPEKPTQYLRNVWLREDGPSGEPFVDLLSFHYFEGAKFTLKLEECETPLQQWLFILKNMEHMNARPVTITDPVLIDFFDDAELAAMSPQERDIYEERLKIQRDNNAVRLGEREVGREEGREEGHEEALLVVKYAKAGKSVNEITTATGLTAQKINHMIASFKDLGIL